MQIMKKWQGFLPSSWRRTHRPEHDAEHGLEHLGRRDVPLADEPRAVEEHHEKYLCADSLKFPSTSFKIAKTTHKS